MCISQTVGNENQRDMQSLPEVVQVTPLFGRMKFMAMTWPTRARQRRTTDKIMVACQ
jgi:hypothetical protein